MNETICKETGVYQSRCTHCGAEPMNAAVAPPAPMSELESDCNDARAALLTIEKGLRGLWTIHRLDVEATAQVTLAFRHVEDARMRLGKVIQHSVGGGVSCFDSGRPTADDGR